MKKCLLAFLLLVCIKPLFSQSVNEGSLASTDGTFNRPDEGTPPTTLSITGTNVFYDVITLNVPVAGLITVNSLSVWDNFIILYDINGFNPLLPLQNAVIANDDLVGPNAGFTYSFPVAGTYTLVICSFKNDVTGSYLVTTSAAIPLPLKLVAFTAAKAGNANLIKWSTADESNLADYQVQVSFDNKNFTDLKNGNIAPKNNIAVSSYSFTDKSPARGYNYYRLKITERSGRIAFSHVALVRNTRAGITSLHVFPNPASEYLQIEVKSMVNKKALVSVINTGGAMLQNSQYMFNNQSVIKVDVKRLPAGKYFLKTVVDAEESTIVFIKN